MNKRRCAVQKEDACRYGRNDTLCFNSKESDGEMDFFFFLYLFSFQLFLTFEAVMDHQGTSIIFKPFGPKIS